MPAVDHVIKKPKDKYARSAVPPTQPPWRDGKAAGTVGPQWCRPASRLWVQIQRCTFCMAAKCKSANIAKNSAGIEPTTSGSPLAIQGSRSFAAAPRCRYGWAELRAYLSFIFPDGVMPRTEGQRVKAQLDA